MTFQPPTPIFASEASQSSRQRYNIQHINSLTLLREADRLPYNRINKAAGFVQHFLFTFTFILTESLINTGYIP
jgi:hypothetical protein